MSEFRYCPTCGNCCQLDQDGVCAGAYEGICHVDNPDPEDPISLQEQLAASESARAAAEAQLAEMTAERDAAQGQMKHWRHLKKHYHHEYDQSREQLAAYRAEVAPLLAEHERLLGFMENLRKAGEMGAIVTIRPNQLPAAAVAEGTASGS